MKIFCSMASICCKSLLAFFILILISFFLLWLVSIFQQLGPFPDFLKIKDEGTNSVNEIDAVLAFIASVATVALAYIAYSQVSPIKNTLKMEFIRHLDEQWISKEITAVRCELWEIYWKELKKTNNEKHSVITVQKYVENLHTTAENDSSKENMEKLFQYLNFMDVMGTIYIYKNSGVLEEKDIKTLYAGRLKRYLDFYKIYFENRCKKTDSDDNKYEGNINKDIECKNRPNAMRLLEEWKD